MPYDGDEDPTELAGRMGAVLVPRSSLLRITAREHVVHHARVAQRAELTSLRASGQPSLY